MRPSRSRQLWGWLAIAVLLGLMWPVQVATSHYPMKERFRAGVLPYRKSEGAVGRYGGYLPGESATIAFIGGFRNIARTLLWIKVDDLWHGARWYRMLPVMVAVTRVDPQFITVWEVFGWHLAWNMNAAAKEQSRAAAADLAAAAAALDQIGGRALDSLPEPLAKELAGAQRELNGAGAAFDRAHTDEARLNAAMSRLRKALQRQRYAWQRAAAELPEVPISEVMEAQQDLLAAAESLVTGRGQERRWIQEGIDVDKAGIRANPDRFEMYWELSWLYFDRIKDYRRADRMLTETLSKFPANRKAPRERQKMVRSPFYVYHTLAHAYEYQLEVDKAIAAWKRVLREVPDHPIPEVPERSLKELETWGNDPAWGMIMIERDRRIRESRDLPPFEYTSPQAKAALAWWEKNKDDPEAVERIEELKAVLRGEREDGKPKRRFERDEPHREPTDGGARRDGAVGE